MDVFKTLLLENPATATLSGTVAINEGGTGATTAAGARDNLLPDYTSNKGKVLAVNNAETDVEWIATSGGSGTVTSVGISGTNITVTDSPVTTSGTIKLALADTAVTAATYGAADKVAKFTVDAQGRLTSASDVSIAIANTAVSGLGTMSTQNANNVTITGGSISGITDLAVADGGTGVSTVPTNGQLLIGNGTGYTVAALTAGTGITVTNGSGTITLSTTPDQTAEKIVATVTNAESVAITKGQVVYAFSATGNRMSVKLANNSSDATSAKTIGMVSDSSISAGGTGTITMVGVVDGLNIGTYTDGDTLYLDSTNGAFTNVKPYAPNHLVYVGIVERANAGNGEIYVRIQNGYELDEIHDVQITGTPAAGSLIIRDKTNSLWKNATLTAGTNIAVTNADASITVGISGIIASSNGGTGNGFTKFTGATTSEKTYTLPDSSVTILYSGGPLGTPSSGTLSSCSGLPVSTGISGLGTSVATALAVNVGTAGAFVVNGGALGTPSSGTVTNLTGTASININGTVGATTANTGKFTTLEATGVVTVSAGTVTAPAITTTGDTNTGIYFPAADTFNVTTGGTERARIDSSGRLGLNQASPATRLDISGNFGQNIVAVSALSIDCSTGNYFTKTINANSTFTFDSVPASRAFAFTLELTHTSGTITWPTTVKWPADTAPTVTTGKTHLFMFVTDDGGTRWRGASLVDYVN